MLQINAFSQKVSNINSIIANIQQELSLNNLTEIFPIIISKDTVANIYTYSNGYFVLSAYKNFYPLKAFSQNNSISSSSVEFKIFTSILQQDYLLQNQLISDNKNILVKNYKAWDKLLNNSGKTITTDTIGPLLNSLYGQVNCKDENNNLVNVTNYYTPNNYAVGCVAVTLFTTMQYYEWPIHGTSSNSYSDDYGSSTGTYEADFKNSTYRWSEILDLYHQVASSNNNRSALGRLAFHAAVAVEMDFENGGSTSNINRIPNAAKKYFRYDLPIYKTKNDPEFWNLIDSSIQSKSPVQFAVYTSTGAGHAIVCDGLLLTDNPNNKYYHLNMGWWGASNGWYLVQSGFNAGGYSVVDAAVMGMLPVPELSDVSFDIETSMATLNWYYSVRIENPIFEIQQRIENNDWETIADNYTSKEYTFSPEMDKVYYFRVKTSQNQNWSEEVKFVPENEISHLNEINLYPTMANSKIFIEYNNLKNAELYIYTTNGSIAYYENFGDFQGFKKEVDVSNLPRAIYIAKIITSDNHKSFKMAVEGWEQ